MATAFITGVTGQDGRYLAEHLLREGDRVVGIVRAGRSREAHLGDGIAWAEWDFVDVAVLEELLHAHRPTQFYNLAAHATGAGMYDDPVAIGELNGIAVARMLQAIERTDPAIRFCQA